MGLKDRSPRAAPGSSFPASGRPSAPGLLQRFPISQTLPRPGPPPRYRWETEVPSVAATRPRSPCAQGLEPRCATSTCAARGTAQVGRGESRPAPAPLPRQRPSLTSCRRARSPSSPAPPPPPRTWSRQSVRPAPRPPPSPLRPGRPPPRRHRRRRHHLAGCSRDREPGAGRAGPAGETRSCLSLPRALAPPRPPPRPAPRRGDSLNPTPRARPRGSRRSPFPPAFLPCATL